MKKTILIIFLMLTALAAVGQEGKSTVTFAVNWTPFGTVSFTGNNTHSGTEMFTGSVPIAYLNGVIGVDGTTYPLTGAGLISAVVTANTTGGGVVDARGLFSAAFTTNLVVPLGVTLLLPSTGTWTFNFSNPAVAAITVKNGGRLIGSANGVVGKFQIEPASGASMDSLVSSDLEYLGTGSGTYVEMDNFALNYNASGATVANGLLHLATLYDDSSISNIIVQDEQAGTSGSPAYGILVQGMCCGASLTNVGVNSFNTNYNIPFAVIDPTNFGSDVGIVNSSFVHPGAGEPIVFINQSGSPTLGNAAINFYNLHGESNGSASGDKTTALFQLVNGNAKVYGGFLAHLQNSPTAYAFQVSNTAGNSLEVYGFQYKAANTENGLNAIDDLLNSVTLLTDAYGNVRPYLRSFTALTGNVTGNFSVIGNVGSGSVSTSEINLVGTQSISGCSLSAATGGTTAGKFASGTSG